MKVDIGKIFTNPRFYVNDTKGVIIGGWIVSYRQHSKLVFVDLHDWSGDIQVVFSTDKFPQAKKMRKGCCLMIRGVLVGSPTEKELELSPTEIYSISYVDKMPFDPHKGYLRRKHWITVKKCEVCKEIDTIQYSDEPTMEKIREQKEILVKEQMFYCNV